MKTGQSLQELAKELDRQQSAKRDFISPTQNLRLKLTPEKKTILDIYGHGEFGIRDLAHQQIGARVGIPKTYYDRMRTEAPELLGVNVNHWFADKAEKRMVRTLDGEARAFLSDRYRPLDNYDLGDVTINALLNPALKASIESCALTETRLYIKARTEIITAEIRKGDVVQAGIVVSNSEVGMGTVKVEPFIFRLVCLNGMIANDHALRKYHVGRGHDGGELAEEFFRDETRQADDRAFWMKVKDVVMGSFRQDVFDRVVDAMRKATGDEIKQDPVKAIEVTQKMFGLNDDERSGVLRWLIKDGDLTRYGLLNAVTRVSQEVPDYDRATELERMGGTVLELPRQSWNQIAEAA
jgi:hypothetical protein